MPTLTLEALLDRLPAAQREVLGWIACNEDSGHPPRVLKALLAKGLLEAVEEEA